MIELISSGVAGLTIGSVVTWLLRRQVERVAVILRHRNSHPIDDNMKLVLVVRRDLNLQPGKLASQCAHAAVTCFSATQKYNPEFAKYWEARGQPKIVVQCNSDVDFPKFQDKAKRLKLITAVIQDAGRTHLIPGTKTVLGVGPGRVKDVDQVTGHLRLY